MTRRETRSPLAILTAALASASSLAGVLFALLIAAFTCDESCDDRSTSWRDNPDAWQWDGQLALGGVAALCSIYALWAAITKRRAAPALIASGVLWGAWMIWNGVI